MATTTLGNLAMPCPVCRRPLAIPVLAADRITVTRVGSVIVSRIHIDGDYLAAHALTHAPHDGEPYSTLSAVA